VWLLDSCTTKFGGRLLRDWVVHPLVQHTAILERQDAVQQLLEARQSGPHLRAAAVSLVTLCSLLLWLHHNLVVVESLAFS
jgi:DNA mismatch repair ATPase MutS